MTKVLWEIEEKVKEINDAMSNLDVELKNIYRDGNMLANYLSNLSIDTE